MRFKKGEPRPPNAGRKKGSLNKKTVLKVSEVLSEQGINPTEKILNLIPVLEPEEQLRAWLELLSYTEVKPKESTVAAAPADGEQALTASDILELVDVTPKVDG